MQTLVDLLTVIFLPLKTKSFRFFDPQGIFLSLTAPFIFVSSSSFAFQSSRSPSDKLTAWSSNYKPRESKQLVLLLWIESLLFFVCDSRKVGYLVLYWIFIMQKTSSTAARVSRQTQSTYSFFASHACMCTRFGIAVSFETNFSTASNQSPMSGTDFTIQIVLTMASLVCINGNPISMEISCLSMLFFSPTHADIFECSWCDLFDQMTGAVVEKKNKQRGESFFWTSLL